MAALLYDNVYLQSGGLQISAGAGGAVDMPLPEELEKRWETASARHQRLSQGFAFSMGASAGASPSESGALILIQNRKNEISWKPTLEPFKRELPADIDWLDFGGIPNDEKYDRLLGRLIARDQVNSRIKAMIPDHFTRSTVCKHVNDDLIKTMRAQFAVSVDRLHARVIEARVGEQFVQPDPASLVLALVLPQAGVMTWQHVHELRQLQEMRTLRGEFAEIGQDAWERAQSGQDLHGAISEAYQRRLMAVAEEVTSTLGSVRTALVGWAFGEIAATALIPQAGLVAGPLGAIAGFTYDRLRSRRPHRFVAAQTRVSRFAESSIVEV